MTLLIIFAAMIVTGCAGFVTSSALRAPSGYRKAYILPLLMVYLPLVYYVFRVLEVTGSLG